LSIQRGKNTQHIWYKFVNFFLCILVAESPPAIGQVATDYMYIVRESGDKVSGRDDSAALSSVDGPMIFRGACISVCCKMTAN
jgi:hypothetical protein